MSKNLFAGISPQEISFFRRGPPRKAPEGDSHKHKHEKVIKRVEYRRDPDISAFYKAERKQHKQEKVRVLLNISNYREKREQDLKSLATKISESVIKSRKSITLEPMVAFDRKVIHTALQESDKVKTYSIGKEPYRKVVVSLK